MKKKLLGVSIFLSLLPLLSVIPNISEESETWTGVEEGEIYSCQSTIVNNETLLDFYHDFNLSLISGGNLTPENISDDSNNGLYLDAYLWNFTEVEISATIVECSSARYANR